MGRSGLRQSFEWPTFHDPSHVEVDERTNRNAGGAFLHECNPNANQGRVQINQVAELCWHGAAGPDPPIHFQAMQMADRSSVDGQIRFRTSFQRDFQLQEVAG